MKKAVAYGIFLILAMFGATAAETAAPVSSCRMLMLWLPQAEFAGFYVAQHDGLYRKAGWDVEILHPKTDEDIFDTLRRNRADVVVGWLVSALARAGAGDDIISLAQLHQHSALMLIARRSSGIRKPEDISGRRVGMWLAPSLRVPAMRYFERRRIAGCKILPVLTTVDLFLYGGIDVTVGMEFDEYYRLFMAGIDPEELTVFRFNDTFPDLADDGIFCKRRTWEKSPEAFRRLREATMEGWRRACADKERTLELVKQICVANHVPFDPAHQRRMLDVMERLIFPAGSHSGILRRRLFDEAQAVNGASGKTVRYEDFAPEAGL